jgi:microcystin-dependent protein
MSDPFLGTNLGGNGTTTYALPNLVGSVAIGQGPGLTKRVIGEPIGAPNATMTRPEMASHSHSLRLGNKTAANPTPGPTSGASMVIDSGSNGFGPAPATTALAPSAMSQTGGWQPHPNTQPTLAMIYGICTAGVFPSFDSA